MLVYIVLSFLPQYSWQTPTLWIEHCHSSGRSEDHWLFEWHVKNADTTLKIRRIGNVGVGARVEEDA